MKRWMPAVRGAIPRCPENFTTGDVCRMLGVGTTGSPYSGIFDVLRDLVFTGELTKQTIKRGKRISVCVFTRTALFRGEEHNPENTAYAAAFLQQLALRWGAARHAQAD